MSLQNTLFWLIAPALQVGLAFLLWRKKLRRQYPAFFTYTVFQVISSVALLWEYKSASAQTYFYSYWTISGLCAVLGFLIVHELFTEAMRPYVGLRDMGRMVFLWISFVMLLVSAVVALSTSGNNISHITAAILTLERCVRLLQCSLLVFLIFCSSYLGLSWKNYPIGVAMGFAVVAASQLFLVVMQPFVSKEWLSLLNRGLMITYDVSVVLWLGYTVAPQSVRARHNVVFRPELDRWNQAALAVQNAGGTGFGHVADAPATYISDIESAVENVLKNNIKH